MRARTSDLLASDPALREELRYLPKPDPSAYAAALSWIDAAAGLCCFVDDTRANLVPARALGMRTVWKARAGAPDEHVQHAIAELSELEALWPPR